MNKSAILNPRVAVFLASYNGEKYIREQLMSIVRQEHVDLHVFVRDDGSKDRTREIVAEVAAETSMISLLPMTESTGSAAGNFIWMIANHNILEFAYTALSDQDDIWAANKISRAIKLMEQEKAEGYSSNLISYSIAQRNAKFIIKSDTQKLYDYLFQGGSAGCTYVFTTDIHQVIRSRLQLVQKNELRYCSHDWLIYAISRSSGFKWILDDEAHIFYRQHADNVYGARTSLNGAISKLKHLKSGWYRQHIISLRKYIANTESEDYILSKIESWTWHDRLYIALNATKFRRNKRDALVLSLCALLGWM